MLLKTQSGETEELRRQVRETVAEAIRELNLVRELVGGARSREDLKAAEDAAGAALRAADYHHLRGRIEELRRILFEEDRQ